MESPTNLAFAALLAVQAGDWRAATVIVNQGIIQFPAEPTNAELEDARTLLAIHRSKNPADARARGAAIGGYWYSARNCFRYATSVWGNRSRRVSR